MKKFMIPILLSALLSLSCVKQTENNPNAPEKVQPSDLKEWIIKDTAYGADKNQKMDIYLPAGRTTSTKTIVLIHGGAWVQGDKNDLNDFVTLFRVRWPEAAIININYRFANGSTLILKNLLDDVESAIGLLVDERSRFQVSENIALFGASAGAHLALMCGYTNRTKGKVKCVGDLFGPARINDWDWYINSGVIPIAEWLQKMTGSVYNAEIYKAASPVEVATGNAPPTIIFHGVLDPLVPIAQSKDLQSKLNLLKVPNEYIEYFAGHGFSNTDYADCATRSVIFFKKYML